MPISEINLRNCPSRLLNLTVLVKQSNPPDEPEVAIKPMANSGEEANVPLTVDSSENKEEIHKCLKCEAEFMTIGKLNLHIKNYHNENIENEFKCKCGANFKDRKGLRSHQRREEFKTVTGNLQCSLCKKEMTTKQGLKRHLEKCGVVNIEKQTWSCIPCKKVYKTERGYNNHMTCH